MSIPDYILQLLALRNSIILPGFGEFYVDDSLKSRPENGAFTPQIEIIRLNPGTKANDYVLAKYIAEKEGISVTEGNEMVKNYVETLLETLQKKKQWAFEGLGICRIDPGSETPLFSSDKEDKYAEEIYGLPTVKLTAATPADRDVKKLKTHPQKEEAPQFIVAQETKKESETIHQQPIESEHSPENTIPAVAEEIDTDDTQPEAEQHAEATIPPEEKKKKRKYILLIILIALLTGLITLGIWKQETVSGIYKNVAQKIQGMMQSEPGDIQKVTPTDTISQVSDKEPDHALPIKPDTLKTADSLATIRETTPAQPLAPKPFVIMAAAFGNKNNAERMVQTLKEEGFPDATIDGQTASGLWRVAAGYYPSENEAQNVIREAQKKDKLQNAFVAPR